MKNHLRDYRSWHFRDRSFLLAVAISLIWHFFWFFAVTIVVSPRKKAEKPKPQMISLGAVLDDSIFKTLVETKPQISEVLYRRPGDLSPAVEMEPKTVERHEPGGVVSVPTGKVFLQSLKGFVDGEKLSPDLDFLPLKDFSPGEYSEDTRGHV